MAGVKIRQMGSANAPAPVETPSQAILRGAAEVDTAQERDARGRVIEVRRISLLQMFRLTEVLGEGASNQARLNLALSACSVTAIDGEKVSFPANLAELEVIFQRLDFHGLAAAGAALARLGSDDVKLDTAKN